MCLIADSRGSFKNKAPIVVYCVKDCSKGRIRSIFQNSAPKRMNWEVGVTYHRGVGIIDCYGEVERGLHTFRYKKDAVFMRNAILRKAKSELLGDAYMRALKPVVFKAVIPPNSIVVGGVTSMTNPADIREPGYVSSHLKLIKREKL